MSYIIVLVTINTLLTSFYHMILNNIHQLSKLVLDWSIHVTARFKHQDAVGEHGSSALSLPSSTICTFKILKPYQT